MEANLGTGAHLIRFFEAAANQTVPCPALHGSGGLGGSWSAGEVRRSGTFRHLRGLTARKEHGTLPVDWEGYCATQGPFPRAFRASICCMRGETCLGLPSYCPVPSSLNMPPCPITRQQRQPQLRRLGPIARQPAQPPEVRLRKVEMLESTAMDSAGMRPCRRANGRPPMGPVGFRGRIRRWDSSLLQHRPAQVVSLERRPKQRTRFRTSQTRFSD